MNTETKLAYRSVISEVLLYMVEPGRTQHDILTVLDKLEKTTQDLIHLEILASMPAAGDYIMKPADQVLFRAQIASMLEVLSREDTPPGKMLDMMKELESWIEKQAETQLQIFAASLGKPRMKITRLPN